MVRFAIPALTRRRPLIKSSRSSSAASDRSTLFLTNRVETAMGSAIYYRPSILKEIRAGVHAVIEASAGTGKTFAIEHLVVDVLLSGECAVDQILVVTFTEKATAELRVRIRQALEKILFGAPSPDPAGNTEPVV